VSSPHLIARYSKVLPIRTACNKNGGLGLEIKKDFEECAQGLIFADDKLEIIPLQVNKRIRESTIRELLSQVFPSTSKRFSLFGPQIKAGQLAPIHNVLKVAFKRQ
jgi:hypothetical protein